MPEYAAVCVGIREYMREYAGVGASMRECTRVRLGVCVGMREYMRGHARVYARECARVCVGMREYAAVCEGIREYLREYAYARVCAPALSDTVRKPCCLSGAVTWEKANVMTSYQR